jgi:hypothetical protein
MTELRAPFGAPPEVVEQRAGVTEASPRTPVLITEQQVLFATAAAVPLQPATTGRRWIEAVRTFLSVPIGPNHPARNDFLEDSRMAREMLRL